MPGSARCSEADDLVRSTVVDFYRRGAFTSMIVSELCILGVLDILWLSTGAYTASKYSPVSQFCSEIQNLEGVGNVKTACATIQTSIAFSFMNFIMRAYHGNCFVRTAD